VTHATPAHGIYFGLMSGTSMDGVDGVAVAFREHAAPEVLAEVFIDFPETLREALFALQQPGTDEIAREALAANALVGRYAECCAGLLRETGLDAAQVHAVGAHGQTVRHRPELGYTRQLNNPALLAELSGIDVVADFRARDIAAGGQGAPLVPAFHATVFGSPHETRVICNLGGISNVTIIEASATAADGTAPRVTGFDCGPANALLDAWVQRHHGEPFDADGRFAAQGAVHLDLLDSLLSEPYFDAPPPKSTGRDLFNENWLDTRLAAFAGLPPADVQATLVALTARSVAREIERHAPGARALYVCGGGARNPRIMAALADELAACGLPGIPVESTASLGVPPQQVEALAFAWLAMRHRSHLSGNLPAVTGARGARVLGALYPR
jgi:anhydro-N-acetylmuramic acid kinase